MHARQKVILLGNCVAERLQGMLPRCPGFEREFVMVPAPMVHLLKSEAEWRTVADLALGCDIIFTQPLFSYGPCNTEALRSALDTGRQLTVFSSPNFEAYFPDAFVLRDKVDMKLVPVFDWDSSIIFSCFMRGVSIFEVEGLYLRHPLFSADAMRATIAAGLEQYAAREKGVDLPTGGHVARHFAGEKLFHSPKHPVDSLLLLLLEGIAGRLGLDVPAGTMREADSFAFNQWSVITRGHGLFRFPEQPYFVAAGQRFSIEDVAMSYYNFYEFNPHIVAANLDRVITV